MSSAQPSNEAPGWRQLLAFYIPLVLTSQMMTLSNPLINLALSRADDQALHLAAYSVAFGLAVFLNAPALVSRDVGAGLCRSQRAYRQLLRQVVLIGIVVGAIDLALAWTPFGHFVFAGLLGTTDRVATEAQRVALALAPIPLFVGIRGLNSALALRAHRTRLLTQATFLRLITVIGILVALVSSGLLAASAVAWSLSGGILLETLWIVWVTRGLYRDLPAEGLDPGQLALGRMLRFAAPLVVSAYAWTALRPVINGILGRCADSEAAQAGFGVLHPLILLTASGLWALQATGQILGTNSRAARRFLGFGLVMTLLFSGLVVLLGWLPAWRQFTLTRLFDLTPELLGYVTPAMKVLFIAPLLLGMRACFKGLILASGRTGVISLSAAADLITVFSVGTLVLWANPGVNGAILGVALVVAAEFVEATLLGVTARNRFGLRLRAN
jgi:O-antigen/teichoic acid export membrane protein